MTGPTRKIGSASVPAIGYGAMGLAAFYGTPKSQKECDEVFSHLIKNGCTHWDTSDIYSSGDFGGLGENETQIGKFFAANKGAREKVFLASKHIFTISPKGERGMQAGSAEYAKEACNNSLKRLGTDHLDLFYLHRPSEPIEESIKGMKELKDEGKIRAIGVSEYNVEQLERANKVAHIDALQIGE
jgi:aryl-alcohol dehydrogenase-like predicted oxidoreductase